jgi:glycosyltransferase involved in cell wall biosynthesis
MNNPKCVVAFAGARDHYQIPLALDNVNLLEKFVTDFYSPPVLQKIFPVLTGKRSIQGLNASNVRICFPALYHIFKSRLTGNYRHYIKSDALLGQAAYSVARETGANLFLYSYYAYDAFSKMQSGKSDVSRILFQLHPHPQAVKEILNQELQRFPAAKKSLMYEHELNITDKEFCRLDGESKLASDIIVASSFTRGTLLQNGIASSRIRVVPYGVNHDHFPDRRNTVSNNKLRVIFVGSIIQRKGLSYLFEAVQSLGTDQIELVLCGRGFVDKDLLGYFSNVPFLLKIGLSRSDLVKELHASDVFIFPSLAEGFGHVILEAMSTGLPVISTTATCAVDIIEDGVDGFVINPGMLGEVRDKLQWCLDNRTGLKEMGIKAAAKSRNYTWSKFRESISSSYQAIVKR